MRYVRCIFAPVATHTPFHYTVSIRGEQVEPAIRQATFKVEKKIGFRYFEYGENVDIQDSPISDTIEEVLNLITPSRALNANEQKIFGVGEKSGWLALDDLEPLKVEEFLNTYGQIGLANYVRREAMNNLITPQVLISQAKIPQGYLKELQKEDSALFRKRIRRIWSGEIIPFSWVEDDLRKLAKIIRVKVALDKNKSEGHEEITLENSKYLRRLIHALGHSGMVIPEYKDSGNFAPLSNRWDISERRKTAYLNQFISEVNGFLSPISRAIMSEQTKEIAQKNSGIETAICHYLFSRVEPLSQAICENDLCRRVFIMHRTDQKWHTDQCGINFRVRKSRAKKKKVSAIRAGSKKKKGRSK